MFLGDHAFDIVDLRFSAFVGRKILTKTKKNMRGAAIATFDLNLKTLISGNSIGNVALNEFIAECFFFFPTSPADVG